MFILYVHAPLQLNTWDLVLFLTRSMKSQQMLDCAHCAENCLRTVLQSVWPESYPWNMLTSKLPNLFFLLNPGCKSRYLITHLPVTCDVTTKMTSIIALFRALEKYMSWYIQGSRVWMLSLDLQTIFFHDNVSSPLAKPLQSSFLERGVNHCFTTRFPPTVKLLAECGFFTPFPVCLYLPWMEDKRFSHWWSWPGYSSCLSQ